MTKSDKVREHIMIRSIVTVSVATLTTLALSTSIALGGPDGPSYWNVERGDTLASIGQQTGHQWQDLCAWNRDQINDCNVIQVGWHLRLFAPNGAQTPPVNGQHGSEGTYNGRTPVETWERLAQCESGGDWYINTGNGYYGGVQFSHGTWQAYGGGQFANNAHLTGKFNQMTIAQRTLDGQGWGAWPHCSREIGMR